MLCGFFGLYMSNPSESSKRKITEITNFRLAVLSEDASVKFQSKLVNQEVSVFFF